MIQTCADVLAVEALLKEEFSANPFHNLFFLKLVVPSGNLTGGTCSDKVLAFKQRLECAGFVAHLHCGFIENRETHRLLAIELNGERYFADVGNGWPSIKLFSAKREVQYSAFGIDFWSKISDGMVNIYQRKEEKVTSSVCIPTGLKPERDVLNAISQRFNSGVYYPFSKGLRFAQVVADSFYFLKGDRTRIFSENKPVVSVYHHHAQDKSLALKQYFGVELSPEKILSWEKKDYE